MKKKILARAGAAVATGALIAGIAASPAFAIRRISNQFCAWSDYLVLESRNPTCWADAGRIEGINLYGVHHVKAGGNRGWVDAGSLVFFEPYSYAGYTPELHVTGITIG